MCIVTLAYFIVCYRDTEPAGELSGVRDQQESLLELQQMRVVNSQHAAIQTAPLETTEFNGSLVQTEQQQTTEPNAQYPAVQKEPKHTKELSAEPKQQDTEEPNTQYSVVQEEVNTRKRDLDQKIKVT